MDALKLYTNRSVSFVKRPPQSCAIISSSKSIQSDIRYYHIFSAFSIFSKGTARKTVCEGWKHSTAEPEGNGKGMGWMRAGNDFLGGIR